jgi:hypothetical protein
MALSERDLVGAIVTPIIIIVVCIALYFCCYKAHSNRFFVWRRRIGNDVELGERRLAPPTGDDYVV